MTAISSMAVAIILVFCTFLRPSITVSVEDLPAKGELQNESFANRTCPSRELHVFILLSGRKEYVASDVYRDIRKLLVDLTERRSQPPCNESSSVHLFIYQNGNKSHPENTFAVSCDLDDRTANCFDVIEEAVTKKNLEDDSTEHGITDCFGLFTTFGQKFVEEYDTLKGKESCKQFLLITNIVSTCVIEKYGIKEMLDKYIAAFQTSPFPLNVIIVTISLSHHSGYERYSAMFPETRLSHLIIPKVNQLVTYSLPYLDFCNNHFLSINQTTETTENLLKSTESTVHPAALSSSNHSLIIFAVLAIALYFCTLLFFGGFAFFVRRKQQNKREEVICEIVQRDRCFSVPNRISVISNSYSWLAESKNKFEIAHDNLTVDRTTELGKGAFAVVFKGHLTGAAPVVNTVSSLSAQYFQDCSVAVKTLLEHADDAQRAQFMREIAVLMKIGFHDHIVNLLGCVTVGQVKHLVMELAEMNLLEYVQSLNKDHPPLACLLSIAWQISDGMSFIASRHFIHCDLAARNVLLTEGQKAMIGDFGLCQYSEHGRVKKSDGKMPIRHMAIESLQKREFSEKSDVWSFGVVLYEMYSYGAVPYQDISLSDIADHLCEGERLERPRLAFDEMFDIMNSTWKERPVDRPNFSQLCSLLTSLLEKSTDYYGYVYAREDSVPRKISKF